MSQQSLALAPIRRTDPVWLHRYVALAGLPLDIERVHPSAASVGLSVEEAGEPIAEASILIELLPDAWRPPTHA